MKRILLISHLLYAVSCLLFTVYCLLFLIACSGEKPKQPPAIVPVTVAAAVTKSVPLQIAAIGNVEAYSTVGIKARVGGELMRVNLKEGQNVNKGDLLFSIDPRPYETVLAQAEANLARDTALAKKAGDDVIRYAALFQEELVSRDDYEQIMANAEALKASEAADRSAVENAKLQLEYCSIYAPVSGRTGELWVDIGDQVKANDDKPMVVINQVKPVYVSFSVPEKNLPGIKQYMAEGKINVEAFISQEDGNPEKGILSFMDNAVDDSTGTIKLKATFDNRDRVLWPGQFVTVKVTLSTIHDAVVVPLQAVQTGQQGQFIFVIKDGAAELRPVAAGITYENNVVIEKGLSPGEEVVTDGQMRLMPGTKVEIKNN